MRAKALPQTEPESGGAFNQEARTPYRIHETPVFKPVRTRRTRRTRAWGKKHAGTQRLSYTRSIFFIYAYFIYYREIFNPAAVRAVRAVRALRRWVLCGLERSRLACGECAIFDSRDPSVVEAWNAGRSMCWQHTPKCRNGLEFTGRRVYRGADDAPMVRGQKKAVTVYRLIAHGTIDERVSKVLGGKIDLQKLILDEIKG